MEFLAGFLGAVAALGLFLGGFCTGSAWSERCFAQRKTVSAEALSDQRQRSLAEEQEAWRSLHNYSVEDAYAAHLPGCEERET